MKTTPVPDELLRELRAELAKWTKLPIGQGAYVAGRVFELAASLPDPPKPDVVEECGRAYANPELGDPYVPWSEKRMRAALRRYRELGCPELDE